MVINPATNHVHLYLGCRNDRLLCWHGKVCHYTPCPFSSSSHTSSCCLNSQRLGEEQKHTEGPTPNCSEESERDCFLLNPLRKHLHVFFPVLSKGTKSFLWYLLILKVQHVQTVWNFTELLWFLLVKQWAMDFASHMQHVFSARLCLLGLF